MPYTLLKLTALKPNITQITMGALRTLFAITVVFAHTPLINNGLFIGSTNAVQMFYMISGFLITHILNANPAYLNLRTFYLSRVLRLYPLYFVVLFLTLLSMAAHPDNKVFELYSQIPILAKALLAGSNLFIFGQDWMFFTSIIQGNLAFTTHYKETEHLLITGLIIPPAWSLGIELSFYLIAPFVLRNISRILILLAVGVAVKLVLYFSGISSVEPYNYRFFPAEITFFMLGALSNKCILPICKSISIDNQKYPALFTTLLFVMSLSYFLIPADDVFKKSLLFITFFLLMPFAFLHQSRSKLDSAIGELSYPIYIGHWLVILIIGYVAKKINYQNIQHIAYTEVFAATLFAWSLNEIIGKKIEPIRKRLKSH